MLAINLAGALILLNSSMQLEVWKLELTDERQKKCLSAHAATALTGIFDAVSTSTTRFQMVGKMAMPF